MTLLTSRVISRWIGSPGINGPRFPVESALHFNEEDAGTLSAAMRAIGCVECLAIATEPLENFPLYYRISVSSEGLLAFSKRCGAFNFALIPESRRFAVMCTVDDYYVVGGTSDFVSKALGCRIQD